MMRVDARNGLTDKMAAEFNQETQTLFVSIHQIFTLFFIYKANVHLTTKLSLVQDNTARKHFIKHQEDLYQTDEVVRFFWPGGNYIIWLFQVVATLTCIGGALALAPITWMEQRRAMGRRVVNGAGKEL